MKDLTKGSPGKLILMFTIPLFFGNLFQLFYSLMDTRIVGETLGDTALAAVGATSTLNNLLIGFLVGLTNGFSILTAHAFGAKDEVTLRKNVAGNLLLGAVIAVILTALSVLGLPVILRFMNMPEELMVEGMKYIRIILLGMIMAMFYNVCASTLRAIGDTVTPLIFLMLSTMSNVILDYLFILGFHMGVSGAAWATVLSQMGAGIVCFIYMMKRYPFLRLRSSDFRLSRQQVILLLKSGLSMGLMQSLVALGTLTLQSAINSLGTTIIVAHTGARKVTEMFMLPFSVLGMSMATYCSQNMGAGRLDRVKMGLKQVIKAAWTWCVIVILLSYTIAPLLIKAITATQASEIVAPACLYLRIDTLFYAVPALISILRNALQGLGDHVTPIVSSCIELVGKILVAFCLTPYLKYMGIILAEPIVWIIMVIPLIRSVWRILNQKGKYLETTHTA